MSVVCNAVLPTDDILLRSGDIHGAAKFRGEGATQSSTIVQLSVLELRAGVGQTVGQTDRQTYKVQNYVAFD